ncbi:MAG: NAD(P)-binding oxidoreductase [Pseudomonadota bacterium]
MSRILVIGASKGIGKLTVETALEHGHEVRAMSRSIDALDITHPALEKFKGDALEHDSVAAALEGQDAVIQTLGMPLNRETITSKVTMFSHATEILLKAMAEQKMRRVICLTGFGAGTSRVAMSALEMLGHGLILGKIYEDKGRQEALIKASDTDWTIARPVILTNFKASGKYAVLLDEPTWRNGLICRADVADYLVRAVDDPATFGTEPVLARGR